MLNIAWHSLRNRWLSASLAVLAVAMSVALILTVDKVRRDARTSFIQTLSGTDLIVGARSGSVQLLLYAVFRMGSATNNVSWTSIEELQARDAVDWLIPLSLGDSHRGFKVLGTSADYFTHYRYGNKNQLSLARGALFDDVFDTVIGSEVARKLDYALGQQIVVAHGTGSIGLMEHDKQPFRVSGILQPTGTPVDNTIHVSLQGIEAMHVDWQSGMKVPGADTGADTLRTMDLQPKAVTAALIGLKSRAAVFREQRAINEYRSEPLLAILPGVAMQELWSLVRVFESALLVVSSFVVLAGLVNLVSVLFAGLNERRREMAILRAAGARPANIFLLLVAESTLLSVFGIIFGMVLHTLVVGVGSVWAQSHFGLDLSPTLPTGRDLAVLLGILSAGVLAGCLPAWRAYRQSVADGLMQRM
ncbi:MAG: ABC transporter permease [Granulosicoccus sp.]|nr:ABC transporter permease [Granulosicoccus sp.]